MPAGKPFTITIPMPTQYVLRALPDTQGGEKRYLVLTGVASDSGEDILDGQMTPDCVLGMVQTVNDLGQYAPIYRNVHAAKQAGNSPRPVTVDIDHSTKTLDQIGFVTRAWAITAADLTPEMIQRGVVPPAMGVEVWINLDKPHGMHVKASIDDGDQLGLSIYGKVDKYAVVRGSKGQPVEQFQRVSIERVAVTSKPANPRTWVEVVRRSLKGIPMDPEDESNTEANTTEAAPVLADAAAPVVMADVQNEHPQVGTPAPGANPLTDDPNPATLTPEALADLRAMGALAPAPVAEVARAVPPKQKKKPAEAGESGEDPAEEAGESSADEDAEEGDEPGAKKKKAVARSAADLTSRLTAVANATATALAGAVSAPAPDPAPEAAEQEVPDDVFRALDSRFDERYVSRAVLDTLLDSIVDQIATVLEPLPGFLEAVSTRLATLENQAPLAPRGTMVLRSLLDGQAVTGDNAPPTMDPAKLEETMAILSRGGRQDLAVMLKMGWLTKDQLPQ